MSDENQSVEPVVPSNQEVVTEANVIPQASPAEVEARLMGWVPKEEFEGDEHKWVDAGEFIRRGELFKKIDTQNKELKEVKQSLKLLADHNRKVEAAAFKKALDTLKAQKKEALLDGDADAVIEIDERILDAKEREKQFKAAAQAEIQQEVQQTVHPEFEAFLQRNPWYSSDDGMKGYADSIGRTLAVSGKAPAEVLKEVEKRVRAEFPHKFRNPNKDRPGAVEGTSSKGATATASAYTPSEFERQAARKFVKQGVFKNEQEYYQQLAKLQG